MYYVSMTNTNHALRPFSVLGTRSDGSQYTQGVYATSPRNAAEQVNCASVEPCPVSGPNVFVDAPRLYAVTEVGQ